MLPGSDLRAFLRLGTGFDNYYEIEVPLNFTPSGTSTTNEIWPVENEINMPFVFLFFIIIKAFILNIN